MRRIYGALEIPKEGQKVWVFSRLIDETGECVDMVKEEGVYKDGWFRVDGFPVTPNTWTNRYLFDKVSEWLKRKTK